MITVQEADKLISENIKQRPAVLVPLQDAYGMVLREDLVADRDLPPFDRVTMDGIGINFASWEGGNKTFPIEGIQKAGIPPQKLKNTNACLEVMTGAVLPIGCNCVVPYEDIALSNGQAKLREGIQLTCRQYIHTQASDHVTGACLVEKGTRLLAPHVAVAASIGKTEVLVSQMPKIAVIGTGDEVVPIDQEIQPHQIRQSNSYAVEAGLKLSGYEQVTRFHIGDDKEELRTRLVEIIKHFDVVILSGGVSMGKFDYVPSVLADIGIEVVFHQVKQRPGKPFWFGKNKENKPVFALPGNPVSTLVCMYRYVLPYLDAALGASALREEFAVLGEDVDVKTDRGYFLPVRVEGEECGRLLAQPVFFKNSGDLASLTTADGFLELPADTYSFLKGAVARLYRF